MRRFFCFWWQCTKRAAHGNAPFANDWQWLIGYPVIAIALWLLGFSYAEFSGRVEVTLTTGLLGVIAAAFFAFLITWSARFLGRLLKAPVHLYDEQKDRADVAEGKLVPRILVGAGVRVVETLFEEDRRRGPDSKWVQLLVKSATDAPLIACEARLLNVERVNDDGSTEPISDEPIYCEWANTPPEQRMRMSVPAGVTQPANVFSVHDVADPELKPETLPHVKPGLLREIQAPGKYRLNIAVSADDAPTVPKSFLLEWDCSYGNIGIKEE
jgi:hypothetical protein